jgi:hypothetical protein
MDIPFPLILSFIEGHPNLRRRIRFNEGNTRIKLDTKVSKELFIKLLNDDFLISQLTELYYDSLNKKPMVGEDADPQT